MYALFDVHLVHITIVVSSRRKSGSACGCISFRSEG